MPDCLSPSINGHPESFITPSQQEHEQDPKIIQSPKDSALQDKGPALEAQASRVCAREPAPAENRQLAPLNLPRINYEPEYCSPIPEIPLTAHHPAKAPALAPNPTGDLFPQVQAENGGPESCSGLLTQAPQAKGGQTDWALAQRLVKNHGHDLRYVKKWKTWLVWDGKRWAKDEMDKAVGRVQQTIHTYRAELEEKIAHLRNKHDSLKKDTTGRRDKLKKRIEKLRKMVKSSSRLESNARMNSILAVAQSDPEVRVSEQLFDRDNWLLNVENGTLDLRTGKLRPHNRGDLITRLAPVEYKPDAPCPTWERFLETVTGGLKEQIDYLRRVVGYCLTGDVSEQVLFFLYGSGSNGKTTFITTLQDMLGDYAIQAAPGLLVEKRNEQHPTELADLFGRRLAVCTETKQGSSFDENRLKQLTGRDRIKGRGLYENFWEFPPTHKIMIGGNHRPTISGTDYGTWRRPHLIPFQVTITGSMKDPRMPDKLLMELPGILAWAVQGCLKWQESGLEPPQVVQEATEEYRVESDEYGDFFGRVCETGPDYRESRKQLRSKFDQWRRDNSTNRSHISDPHFTSILKQRGFHSRRSGPKGSAEIYGLRLRPN